MIRVRTWCGSHSTTTGCRVGRFRLPGLRKVSDGERQANERAAKLEHEPHPGQGYFAGNGCQIVIAQTGIPFSPSREGASWQARYRSGKASDGGFCTRVL